MVDMQHVFKLPEEGASIFRNQIVLQTALGFRLNPFVPPDV